VKTVTISVDNKRYDVTYDDTIATAEQMEQATKHIGYPVSSVTYMGESLTADGGEDRSVSEGETVILDGSSSHGPNGISSYHWTQDSGIPVTIKDANTVQASFVAPDVSDDVSVSFRLTVKDKTGERETDTIAIIIMDTGVSVCTHVNLTPDEAKAMMDANPDLIIIDVREGSEFCSTYGHIPGSLNYPWNSGVLQDRYEELPKDAEIMIVCRSGNRSDLAASFLDSKGFSAVYDIGGIQSWEWDTLTCDGQYTLSATVNPDQSVSLSWDQYWGSDFESYTILRNTFPEAEYPGSEYLWQGENTGMVSYADDSPLMGTSYYRLCIAKSDGTSLCSNDAEITLVAPLAISLFSPVEMSGYTPLRISFTAEASGGVSPYTYAWVFGDGTTGIGENPAHIYSDSGIYTATLTITDAEGEMLTQSALITAVEPDHAPLANAGEPQTVDDGAEVRLDGSGSYDSGGDSLTYLWEQVAGTPATLSDPSVPQPVFTAPNIVSEGDSLTFRLTVSDPAGQESSDTVIINVTGMNLPPMVNAGTNQTVSEGDTVILNGSSSYDSDSMILAYLWTQISGPDVSLSDPSDPRPFFVAPNMNPAANTCGIR